MEEWRATQTNLGEEEIRRNELIHRGNELLGLRPDGYSTEQNAGDYFDRLKAFYSEDTKSIVIVDNEYNKEPEKKYFLLVHEFVHAFSR